MARNPLLIDPQSLVTGNYEFAGIPFSIDGHPSAFSDTSSLLVGGPNAITGVLNDNGTATVQVEETVDGAYLTLRLPTLGLSWQFQMPGKSAQIGSLVEVFTGPGEPSSKHSTIGPPGPPGPSRDITAIVGYSYNQTADMSFTAVTSDINVPANGNHTVTLFDKQFPGGLEADNDFVSEYEGFVSLSVNTPGQYELDLRTEHTIGSTIIWARRPIYVWMDSNKTVTQSLTDYFSRTQIRIGSFTDSEGNTVTIRANDLKSAVGVKQYLAIRRTDNAQFTLKSLSISSNAKAHFWQLSSTELAINEELNALTAATEALTDSDQIAAGDHSNSDTWKRATLSRLWTWIKTKLATVATTGDYTDLTNTPTIPTVPDISGLATKTELASEASTRQRIDTMLSNTIGALRGIVRYTAGMNVRIVAGNGSTAQNIHGQISQHDGWDYINNKLIIAEKGVNIEFSDDGFPASFAATMLVLGENVELDSINNMSVENVFPSGDPTPGRLVELSRLGANSMRAIEVSLLNDRHRAEEVKFAAKTTTGALTVSGVSTAGATINQGSVTVDASPQQIVSDSPTPATDFRVSIGNYLLYTRAELSGNAGTVRLDLRAVVNNSNTTVTTLLNADVTTRARDAYESNVFALRVLAGTDFNVRAWLTSSATISSADIRFVRID